MNIICVLLLKILKEILHFKNFVWSWLNAKALKSCGRKFFIGGSSFITGSEYISIGHNFRCGKRLRLEALSDYFDQKFQPEILIGDNVSIQDDCHIGAINRIYIGDNVLIASKVYISDHSHGKVNSKDIELSPMRRNLYSKGDVNILNNVWIGENVSILPGVTIGHNTIVGANSVVTKSIESNCVVAGNPARIVKLL